MDKKTMREKAAAGHPGWPLFPFKNNGDALIGVEGWGSDKLTSEEAFKQMPDFDAIGVMCGAKLPNGRWSVVLDFDKEQALNDFETQYPHLAATRKEKGSKGGHLPYETDVPMKAKKYKKDGKPVVEVFGLASTGNCTAVIVAPSIHRKNGQPYEVLNDVPPLQVSAAELTAALEATFGKQAGKQKTLEELLEGVAEGERNNAAFKIALHFKRKENLTQEGTLSKMREWNELNQPPLEESELQNAVASAYKPAYAEAPTATQLENNRLDGLTKNANGFIEGKFDLAIGDNSETAIRFKSDGIFKEITRYLRTGERMSSALLSSCKVRLISLSRLESDYGAGVATYANLELVMPNGNVVPYNGPVADLPSFIVKQGRGMPHGLDALGLAFSALADQRKVKTDTGAPYFGIVPLSNGKLVFADGTKVPVLAQYPAAREAARKASDSILNKPRGTVAGYAGAVIRLEKIYEKIFPELIPITSGWFGIAPLGYPLRREVALFPMLGFEGAKHLGKSQLAISFASALGNADELSGETLKSPFRMLAAFGIGLPTVINEAEGVQGRNFPLDLLKNAATQPVASARGSSDLGIIPMLSAGSFLITSNVGLISSSSDAGGSLGDRYIGLNYQENVLRDAFRADDWLLKREFDSAIKDLMHSTFFGGTYLNWLATQNFDAIVKETRGYENELLKSPILLSRKPLAYAIIYEGLQLLKRFFSEQNAPIPKSCILELAAFRKLAEDVEGGDRLPTDEGYSAACLLAEIISTYKASFEEIDTRERKGRAAREIEEGKDGIYYDGGDRLLVSTMGLAYLNRENNKRCGLAIATSLNNLSDKLATTWRAEGLSFPVKAQSHTWKNKDFKALNLNPDQILRVANRAGNQTNLEFPTLPTASNRREVGSFQDVKTQLPTIQPTFSGGSENIFIASSQPSLEKKITGGGQNDGWTVGKTDSTSINLPTLNPTGAVGTVGNDASVLKAEGGAAFAPGPTPSVRVRFVNSITAFQGPAGCLGPFKPKDEVELPADYARDLAKNGFCMVLD